ncbi:MAG: flavodoxin domain-containing protein [Acidimicrobiia bacterium]|nr:flavodoxin domain-containing protein [Acidimicrobiia bacterium]
MKSCVVFESMYGNTHEIAEAVASGLRVAGEVTIGSVNEIPAAAVSDADLVVVGGPTHAHGMSRAASRVAAVETAAKDDAIEAEPHAEGPGLRDWFRDVPEASGRFGAAFDTRIDKPAVFTGSAAKGIAKHLRRHHYKQLTAPKSFFVDGAEGPLKEGEVERARTWAEELAQRYEREQG